MILWVDDDKASLKPFKDESEEEGFTFSTVDNPIKMMEVINKKAENISCIIMDIMLPTGFVESSTAKMGLTTGWELCKILKKDDNTKNIPLIIFTIVEDADVMAWAKNNGVPFLRKKRCFPQDLINAICAAEAGLYHEII